MDRQHIEIDLPAVVANHFAREIDTWLEWGAQPGERLEIAIPDGVIVSSVLAHPAVTATGAVAEKIVLRLVDLQGVKTPMYLIEAADRPSKRAIDALEERLKPPRPSRAPDFEFSGFASGWRV